MERIADKLIQGAIDIHAHSYPEYTLSVSPRLENLEWAKMAKEYGMKGFVMKSHIWPTVMQAFELKKMVSDIEIMGSISLNFTVGGLNPVSTAIAGELGAKIVYMPTWSANNDILKSGVMLNRIKKICPYIDESIKKEGGGISILDNNQKIKGVVKEIISIAKTYNMAISSGHLSIEESIKLAEETTGQGAKFVLSHPHNKTISASHEQQKTIAYFGGYIEHTFIACMPMHLRVNPRDIAKSIEAVGVDNTIITSDSFGPWNPPAPEILRMFIETLLALGFSEGDVSKMVNYNPSELLGLASQLRPNIKNLVSENGGNQCQRH